MLRDPQMSEWGNPAEAIPSLHQNDVERTRGTETSKYLQERKSTETPKVAASEIGPAERH